MNERIKDIASLFKAAWPRLPSLLPLVPFAPTFLFPACWFESPASVESAWSIDIPLEEAFVHYYSPESRLVTLNHSNISVDLVNFTDNSLIPISGYVSYEDTPCFIEGAEITVDELSLIPPLKTSEDGKFTIELEPGTVGSVMRAVYGNDTFVPNITHVAEMYGTFGVFFIVHGYKMKQMQQNPNK